MNEKPSNDPAELIQHYYEGLRPGADDVLESTGLVPLGAVRRALDDALDDTLLGGGNADEIRAAIAQALVLSECRQSWREQLRGAGLDSVAGKRVLSAVRHAARVLELDVHARNIQQAAPGHEAEAALVQALERVLRDAAAEVDGTVPDLLDLYKLPSGALWCLPRDPLGQPLFWERKKQRLVSDPRADRDWMVANLGQVIGSGWRKARIGTASNVPEAEQLCRRQPGQGDAFQRALEAERNGEA